MVSVLYHAHPFIKCSLDISSFLEEISVFPILLFPLFLCIVHLRRLSYLSLLFFGTLLSDGYVSLIIFILMICWIILFWTYWFKQILLLKLILSAYFAFSNVATRNFEMICGLYYICIGSHFCKQYGLYDVACLGAWTWGPGPFSSLGIHHLRPLCCIPCFWNSHHREPSTLYLKHR